MTEYRDSPVSDSVADALLLSLAHYCINVTYIYGLLCGHRIEMSRNLFRQTLSSLCASDLDDSSFTALAQL